MSREPNVREFIVLVCLLLSIPHSRNIFLHKRIVLVRLTLEGGGPAFLTHQNELHSSFSLSGFHRIVECVQALYSSRCCFTLLGLGIFCVSHNAAVLLGFNKSSTYSAFGREDEVESHPSSEHRHSINSCVDSTDPCVYLYLVSSS